MKKRLASILILAMAGTMILGGCGGNGGGDDGKTSDGKAKIRFATWDEAEDVDTQQEMVDRFNEAHDDIEVTLEAYGGEFDTKIAAGMGSKDAPDVMYMWNYPAYANGLEELDSYIDKEGADYKANFYDTLWNYNSLNGKTYGIPVGFTTHALFYNKAIFKEAQIEEPTDDWTWDDLIKAAKTITEKCEGKKGFSFQMKPDPYDFEMYLWSNGTAYCDDEGNLEGNLNSKEAKEVFQMFQDMEEEGYAVATEKSGGDEFRAGSTGMYIYGSWAIDSLNEAEMDWGVVKIPSFAGKGPSASILSSSGLSISKDSKNKEAAWEFIKYWTSEELNTERIGSEQPVLYSVVEAEKMMEKPEYAPFYEMLEQSGDYTPASFKVERWSELAENLSLTFEEVFNPSSMADVSDSLDTAADQ
ncbi:MAG: sugar ABC transporter substrate-binding protein [Coprococcus sp.]|nr:sugar ABC transporter substrate-binding protein [Coprococcus sp.]